MPAALFTAPRRVLIVLIGLAALVPGPVLAQQCTGAGQFRIVSARPNTIRFAQPVLADFLAGSIDAPREVTVTVFPRNGNQSWNLCIRSDDPGLGGGKPLTDLRWSTDGVSWAAVTGTDQLIDSGTGRQQVVLYFQMALSFDTDAPGTYEATLTFTGLHP